MTLGKWVKKAREFGRVPDKDLSEPERAELERLRKENATLRMERDFAKKVIMPAGAGTRDRSRLVRERTAVKYAAIADWATDKQFTVTFMCAQLGVARQGYYRWLADGSYSGLSRLEGIEPGRRGGGRVSLIAVPGR